MNADGLFQLEQQIRKLSTEEQFWVLERVVHQLRNKTSRSNLEVELAAMAADPEIQRELQKINEEFEHAEENGLEKL